MTDTNPDPVKVLLEACDLLPCPFCGAPAMLESYLNFDQQDNLAPHSMVKCGGYECTAEPYVSGPNDAEAIARWNTRKVCTCGAPNDWEEMTDPNDPRSPVEEVTKAQWDDLQDRLRVAALQWQTDHAIKLKPWTFSQVRNSEDVSIPYPEEIAP